MASGTINKNMVLLWENPNPSAAFAAQTITFSDNYPLYMILYYRLNTDTYCMSQVFAHGAGLLMIGGSGYGNAFWSRAASWRSGGGLNIDGCYAGTTQTTTTQLIPYRIYGIRA